MMSNKIIDTEDLIYIPKDIVEIVNDFRNLYSKLDAKIKNFILTQPTFLGELRKELKTNIAFLSPQKKDMALSIYGIIMTEDIIKKYNANYYAEDISALLEATKKKMQCTDDEFVGLLSSFVNCLKTVTNSINFITHNFIELSSLDVEDQIIQLILTIRNFKNALTEAYLFFEVGEFNIDLRFIAAIFAHIIEMMIYDEMKIEKVKSTGKIYSKLIDKYPLSEGEDILFDLINTSLINPYYDLFKETFKATIKKQKEKSEEKFALVRKEYNKSKKVILIKGRLSKF